jgi:hypothetical protein
LDDGVAEAVGVAGDGLDHSVGALGAGVDLALAGEESIDEFLAMDHHRARRNRFSP